MRLEVSDLQARKSKFGIHDVKTSCKTGFVRLVLTAQSFVGKFTRLGKAHEPTLCVFEFTPTLFDQELQVVHRFFFEATQRTVHRLCRTHLGAGVTTLENIPLQFCAESPFRFQQSQIPCIKFLVAKQSDGRVIIGLSRLDGIVVTLAFDTQLTESRVVFDGELLEFFHRTDSFRSFDGRRRGKACVRVQQAVPSC